MDADKLSQLPSLKEFEKIITHLDQAQVERLLNARYLQYAVGFDKFQKAWLEASAVLLWPDHYEERFTPERMAYRASIVQLDQVCQKLCKKLHLLTPEAADGFLNAVDQVTYLILIRDYQLAISPASVEILLGVWSEILNLV
jgi:uncharacterized protein